MEQMTWIFLGCIATAITAATLFTSVEDILGGLVGMLAWALWALGATNLEYRREAVTYADSQMGLAFFGAGMAAVCLIIMLVGAGKMLDVRDAGFEPQQR